MKMLLPNPMGLKKYACSDNVSDLFYCEEKVVVKKHSCLERTWRFLMSEPQVRWRLNQSWWAVVVPAAIVSAHFAPGTVLDASHAPPALTLLPTSPLGGNSHSPRISEGGH